MMRQFLQLWRTMSFVILSGICYSSTCFFIISSTICLHELSSPAFLGFSLCGEFCRLSVDGLSGLSGLEGEATRVSNRLMDREQCLRSKDSPSIDFVVIKIFGVGNQQRRQSSDWAGREGRRGSGQQRIGWMGCYNQMRDECYEFLKNETGKVQIVGFGSYGEVKLARNTENGEVVAIKMIYNKNAKEEIDVHHKLNHPNIIKLLNYYYEKEKNTTYMVLEFASAGSLNEKIKFGYGQLSKALVKRYFRDICDAVRYLHQNNYMHRDIKPENILITKDNHAKLCDFGFASILEYRSTLCGTFEYMAPEMIQKKPYDYKIDIWGLGILLFELIQGYAPFRGETGEEVIAEMKKPLIFSNRFDSVEIDLIKKILRVNAENRLQISKIFDHPYFKDADNEEPLKEDLKPEPTKPKEPKFPKELKDLKEDVVAKPLKTETDPKKKEGDRKFDFLQRKGEVKKELKTEKAEEGVEKKETKEGVKEVKEEVRKEEKKEEKKEFKPYVPPSLQNQRSGIKSPVMKQMPPGYIPMPVSPTGFQQNPHQFNSSMQVPPSHVQSNPLNSNAYQFPNPNASMTTPAKHFPPNIPPPSYQANFSKPVGPVYFMEPRSPNHQSFNSQQQQQPVPQINQGYWKKT